ncbi:MAG: hypothetical protein HON90_00720 [Halobacteriovoraceae bacterium]|jgi:ketol-acid reductoisomerase|nr:hypothetical protein [Halobacteriovoraceae bacterium]
MVIIGVKKERELSIIGFGNQAKSWSLNLRDSGYNVFIGLRKNSSSQAAANSLGFKTFCFEQDEIPTDAFALLIPDDQHEQALKILTAVNHSKKAGLYAHGFSLDQNHLADKYPHWDHVLLAPKSIASELRFLYETKGSLGGFYSLDAANNFTLSQLTELATAIGLTNIYPASAKEETQADLFSEQTILCSLLPYGILEVYNTLIKRGYSNELAFYECFYESKLIIDTMLKRGPKDFFNLISPNALIGSEIGKDLFINQDFKDKLNHLLDKIENNQFQESIQDVDIDKLRTNISNFWQDQSLHNTYEKLRDTL